MRGQNICFERVIRKIILKLSLLPVLIWSTDHGGTDHGAATVMNTESSVVFALDG